MQKIGPMRKYVFLGLIALGISLFGDTALADQTYCVSCEEPDKLYLCNVSPGISNPGRQAAQLYCVVQIAKMHGHKSCSVKNLQGLPCPGTLQSLIYTGPAIPSPTGTQNLENDGQNPLPQQETAQPKRPKKEPDTLVDFTNQTVKQTGDQIKKAGKVVGNATKETGQFVKDAAKKTGKTVKDTAVNTGQSVNNAAKKTLNCLTSFFTDCF